jgi:hypothetical protein
MADDSAKLRGLLRDAMLALTEAEMRRAKNAKSDTDATIADLRRAVDLLSRQLAERNGDE